MDLFQPKKNTICIEGKFEVNQFLYTQQVFF